MSKNGKKQKKWNVWFWHQPHLLRLVYWLLALFRHEAKLSKLFVCGEPCPCEKVLIVCNSIARNSAWFPGQPWTLLKKLCRLSPKKLQSKQRCYSRYVTENLLEKTESADGVNEPFKSNKLHEQRQFIYEMVTSNPLSQRLNTYNQSNCYEWNKKSRETRFISYDIFDFWRRWFFPKQKQTRPLHELQKRIKHVLSLQNI